MTSAATSPASTRRPVADRAALRAELGWHARRQVCVVTVGGSGVGGHLLRRVNDAFDAARDRVPGCGWSSSPARASTPASIAARPGLEVYDFVPELHRQLAAADLAVVQGGLTTTMELTGIRRAVHLHPAAAPLRAELPRGAPARRGTAPGAAWTTTTSRPTRWPRAIADEMRRRTVTLPAGGV